MTNRIGKYYGELRDIERANDALTFCHIMSRSCEGPCAMQDWELESLGAIQLEAIAVFGDFGFPFPWDQFAHR
jgi:hypothetical protein